jgi:hypothetical protein
VTPEAALTAYRHSIDVTGEVLTLRTFTGSGAARTPTDVIVRARVRAYEPSDMAGGTVQGDREIIVLAADVPTAPVKGDQVLVRGKWMTVQAVDDSTRRIADTLMAYVIVARGG